MTTTLVVVAQRSRARLFDHKASGKGLTEIQDLVHPEARLHGLDLETERPGRVHDRVGPARHGMAQEETTKEREASNFAREVADAIETRRTHEGFDQLILIAEPGFLGMLRKTLDPVSAKNVLGEVRKEIVDRKVDEIAGYLKDLLIV